MRIDMAGPLLACLAVLATPGGAATVGFTPALDGVADEVDARRDELGPVVGKPTKEQKALVRADAILDVGSASVADDIKLLGKVAKVLGRGLPGDEGLDGALGSAQDDLRDSVLDIRTTVVLQGGDLESAAARSAVFAVVGKVDLVLTKAQAAATRAKAAALLRSACMRLVKVARKYDLLIPAYDVPLHEPGEVVAEVELLDVNDASPTAGEYVSPRDHLGGVSAWYFGHAT
jgi:hypothetical protein